MKQYRKPPNKFMEVMYDVNADFDYTHWEDSPEWRLFLAGRVYEAEHTLIELKDGLNRNNS